jgi:PAS domain S-box-containing protein
MARGELEMELTMDDLAVSTRWNSESLTRLNFLLARETNGTFLESFVAQTADIFDADFLYIARLSTANRSLQTVRVSALGAPSNNFSYGVDGTPCADALKSNAVVHRDHVASTYPEDYMLQEMGIRGYVGIPLFDGAQAIGIIVALFKHPVENSDELLAVFNHYRRRITGELVDAERIERASLAVEGTSDGIWDWFLQTGQIYLSARCRELLGYDPHEWTGDADTFLALVHRDDRARMNAARITHAESGRPFDLSIRLKTVGGISRWFRVCARAVRTPEGDATRLVGTIADIHDLVEARQQATEASRAKSKFLATMSHEVRTPMNGILGMSAMLSCTELDASQKEMIDLIETSGQALLGILNDILDLAYIESGRFEIEDSHYGPATLTKSIVEPYRMKALEKGLQFYVEVDPCAENEAEGDPTRVRQILSNLLSNAVKYTDRGEIRVQCLKTQTDDGQAEVVFKVRDTGIGISPEMNQRLFTPFTQGESVMARDHGGTGLGLAISKKLAELMGGDITFESVYGAGSQFVLRLPAPVFNDETAQVELLRV